MIRQSTHPRYFTCSRCHGQLASVLAITFIASLLLCTLLGRPSPSSLYLPPRHSPRPDSIDASSPQRRVANSIVIPAFHEARSLEPLIARLADALPPASEIIVVDDDSRDGTDAVVSNARPVPGLDLRLITRLNSSGLSSAVLDGMSAARGDVVLVMDADGQHPPESAAAMIRQLRAHPKVRMAVGTRESVDASWPWYRRLLSSGARSLAWPLVGGSVEDPMTGFFAVRKEVFHQSPPLNAVGFKVALELLLKSVLVPSKFPDAPPPKDRTLNFPYSFEARRQGSSKLGCKVMIQYAMQLFSLYYWRMGWFLPVVMCWGMTGVLYAAGLALAVLRGRLAWRARYERIRRSSDEYRDGTDPKA